MSNSQLSTFDFKSNPVRVEIIQNEPHFALKDVCIVLGLKIASPERFSLDPKGVTLNVIPTKSGKQELTFINEPNLYWIIFKSRKNEAVEFQNWVFDEVLPEIRKTGAYQSKTTVDDRTGSRNAVNMLVSKKGLIYSEAYNLVHQYMNVESIEDIPAEKLPMAVEYVHKIAQRANSLPPLSNQLIAFKCHFIHSKPSCNTHALRRNWQKKPNTFTVNYLVYSA